MSTTVVTSVDHDVQELNELLQKAIQGLNITVKSIATKFQERDAEVSLYKVQKKRSAEAMELDLQQIHANVTQLLEENELLKKKQKPSKFLQDNSNAGRRSSVDLQAAESRNTQLSKRLAKAEAELQALKLSQLRMESVAATKSATQNSSLIEKLYSAQKDRDKAVEEERLFTTNKLSQVEKQLQKERAEHNRRKTDSNVDSHTVEELLPELLQGLAEANGVEHVEQKGKVLLEHVYEWQRLQNNKRSCIEDEATELMKEIEHLKKQQKVAVTEHKLINHAELKALQDQLKAAVYEKNKAIHQLHKLESEHDDLRILYSLQRHLTQESEIKQQYEEKVDLYKQQFETAEQKLTDIAEELNVCIKERNEAIRIRNQLAQDLLTEQERSDKLDRIVMVLRRKVQASSSDSTPTHI